MRIIINGQQAFGRAVLQRLLDNGEDVVGVFCGPDQAGIPIDPLKELALEHNLQLFQPRSFRKQEVWDQISALEPDLAVMAYVTLYVPEEALSIPKLGTIQYHPSLLPMHKGPSSINWPIIQGETKTGLSIFWPDNGLDTGPVLLQKEVPIGPDDTLGQVYFEHLFPLGVDAMLEAIELVKQGTAPKIEQDPASGSYEGWCRKEESKIDWHKPAHEVYNLIRGCNPQPGAWTTLKNKEVQIYDSQLGDTSRGKPGTVVAISEDHIEIAAQGGSIRAQRIRVGGGQKIPAQQFVQNESIEVGDPL